jgi:hypothetical protein
MPRQPENVPACQQNVFPIFATRAALAADERESIVKVKQRNVLDFIWGHAVN